jgi:hypothetical protein
MTPVGLAPGVVGCRTAVLESREAVLGTVDVSTKFTALGVIQSKSGRGVEEQT